MTGTEKLAGIVAPSDPVRPCIVIFQFPNFDGEHLTLFDKTDNLGDYRKKDGSSWNDSLSSFMVLSGRWLLCQDAGGKGAKWEANQIGGYRRLDDQGLPDNTVTSVYPIG